MKAVDDPRSPRAKKHDLAEVLTCIVAGYVTGHITLRRCLGWCRRHVKWLRKRGLSLKNGIVSLSTVSRLLAGIDEELFLFVFIQWIGEIVQTKGVHLAVDGKAVKGAAAKVKGERAPMFLNVVEAATGLVLAHLPISDKESEITSIPELLKYLNIQGSIITTDALGTQTSVMEQVIRQGGHFVMMVKKNQPNSYEEIIRLFETIEKDRKRMATEPAYQSQYPELNQKYDEISCFEKNRDRYEYREYRIINDPACVSRAKKEWPFLKSVGYVEQTRIRLVRDREGNDITPDRETFRREGSSRQPSPRKGDEEKDDIQVVGIVSDMEMSAEDMGKCKRNHWSVENRLHHVLDDTFREDRSPAKKSKNNLALIRKFAYNLLRLAQIQKNLSLPMTEIMDLLCDDKVLLGKYIFHEIESFY
jgi:transposase DDE domain